MQSFLDICNNHPDHLQSCVKAARCYLKLGDYTEADKYITGVIEKDETIIEALRIKVFILLKRGAKAEARLYLDKILGIDPENEWAQRMLAIK